MSKAELCEKVVEVRKVSNVVIAVVLSFEEGILRLKEWIRWVKYMVKREERRKMTFRLGEKDIEIDFMLISKEYWRFLQNVIELVDVGVPNLLAYFMDGVLWAYDEVCGQWGWVCKGDT